MGEIVSSSCPFCGSSHKDIVKGEGLDVSIECQRCGATGPVQQSAFAAVAAWNSRAMGTLTVVRANPRRKTTEVQWSDDFDCWECSWCGEDWGREYDDPERRPRFDYCSHCGREVVG